VINFNINIVFSSLEMSDSKEHQFIQQMIREHPVMVFSKPGCPYCKMAKEVLDGIGVVYFVEEIDSRPDCDQLQNVFQQMTGGRTVSKLTEHCVWVF